MTSSAIEDRFGTQLLVRGGRTFTWTAEGKVVLAAAETVEATVLSALRTVRSAGSEPVGNVRVSTTSDLVAILAPVLPALQKRYPALEIELSGAFERVDLAKGEADIALRFARPTEPELIARHVVDADWALYASKSYLAERGVPESYDALSGHRLVLYAASMQRYGPGLRWLEDYRRDDTVVNRVDNVSGAERLLALGVGIGSVLTHQGDANPALVRVFAEPITHHEAYLVYHSSLRDTARIRASLDVLTEAIASQAHKLSARPLPTGRELAKK